MSERSSLDALFAPRTVALVGASSDPGKLGGLPLAYCRQARFGGKIIPVNARTRTVQGLDAVPSIDDIEEPVDCAIIAVPATAVVAEIERCAAKGVRSAVVFSSGFAERGPEGRAEQERLAAAARASGLRILGPNCMGLFDVKSRFYATFLAAFEHHGGKGWPAGGPVAVVSQSGAIGAHIYVLLRDRGVGLTRWVTAGNQCDIDVPECIAYMAGDEDTRVIVCYIEGVRDRFRLERALELARSRGKAVVVLKVGTTQAGANAIVSHTASLAGADAGYEALFRSCGAYRAVSFTELVDVAAACAKGNYPGDRNVVIVSVSGGGGVILADACEQRGLQLRALSAAAQARLSEYAPLASTSNPLDMGAAGMVDMSLAARFLEVAFEDGSYSTAIAFLTHLGLIERLIQPLADALRGLRQRHRDKLLLLIMSSGPEVRTALEADGLLVFEEPTRAVNVAAALNWIGDSMRRTATPPALPDLPAGVSAPPLRRIAEREAKSLLSEIGVPAVADRLVRSAAEAEEAAAELGFPVAMKIASPDIAHKSEVGGVMLDVVSREGARAAYEGMVAAVGSAAPNAKIDGVLVSPMIAGGVETVVGMTRDPVLGAVMMFGTGGVFVEIQKDVAFRLAPFGHAEALRFVDEVKGAALLKGARGARRCDIDALADVIARLSVYCDRFIDRIETLEINPLIVLPEGRGCVAVDALIGGVGQGPESSTGPGAPENPGRT